MTTLKLFQVAMGIIALVGKDSMVSNMQMWKSDVAFALLAKVLVIKGTVLLKSLLVTDSQLKLAASTVGCPLQALVKYCLSYVISRWSRATLM